MKFNDKGLMGTSISNIEFDVSWHKKEMSKGLVSWKKIIKIFLKEFAKNDSKFIVVNHDKRDVSTLNPKPSVYVEILNKLNLNYTVSTIPDEERGYDLEYDYIINTYTFPNDENIQKIFFFWVQTKLERVSVSAYDDLNDVSLEELMVSSTISIEEEKLKIDEFYHGHLYRRLYSCPMIRSLYNDDDFKFVNSDVFVDAYDLIVEIGEIPTIELLKKVIRLCDAARRKTAVKLLLEMKSVEASEENLKIIDDALSEVLFTSHSITFTDEDFIKYKQRLVDFENKVAHLPWFNKKIEWLDRYEKHFIKLKDGSLINRYSMRTLAQKEYYLSLMNRSSQCIDKSQEMVNMRKKIIKYDKHITVPIHVLSSKDNTNIQILNPIKVSYFDEFMMKDLQRTVRNYERVFFPSRDRNVEIRIDVTTLSNVVNYIDKHKKDK